MWSSPSQRRVLYCLALGLSLTCRPFPSIAWGQVPKAVTSNQQGQAPAAASAQDPLGRTTPRGTVLGFLGAAYNQKYDTACQYLNTHSHGNDTVILAKQLFFVLDRRLPAKLNNVSNDPLGSLSNPVDPTRELIGSVVTEHGGADIYLERIERPNGDSIWLFSRDTLADIPDVYHDINATTVESLVPDFLLRKFLGLTAFGWMYFFVLLPLLYVALSLVNRLVGAALGGALRKWARRPEMRNPTILPHPLRLLIISATVYSTVHEVTLSLLARQVGTTVALLLLIVALIWATFLVSARFEAYLKRRMESQGRISSTAVLRPARRVMDLITVIVGLMFLLHGLGINPSATLAGLGVGGIAIALAAQKTLENVIGGASLIMDDAVRVGDFFKMGDVTGTIEVIGLRSTRVRTLGRTLVTIPNGQIATMVLENFSARDQFWLRHLIGLEYRTPSSALNSVLADVRALLERDTRVIAQTTRVRFLRFGESNLELEIFAYLSARDWNHFLEIQEDLLMRMREVIGSAGVEIGYPARAIHLRSRIETEGALLEGLPPGAAMSKEAVHELQNR